MFQLKSVCVVFILQIASISCLNVLSIFPLVSKSHFKAFEPLLFGLAETGHNVTVLGYFPTEEKIPNYNEIVMGPSDYFDKLSKDFPLLQAGSDGRSRKLIYSSFFHLPATASQSCRLLFEAEPFEDFLNINNTFDVIITELFQADCVLALKKKFYCPIVRVSTATYMPWAYGRFGLPLNPSYMPNILLPFTETMTFWQRLENTIITAGLIAFYHHNSLSKQNKLVAEYFGDSSQTLQEDIYKNSLLLVNRHFIFPCPMPTVPNVIEVGGISVSRKRPLKSDLEKWINESKDGVIFFSLGSVIMGKTMPENKKDAFLRAFKRLPQRVIWKWENDTMEGKSDNIRIGKWLPQFDILSHPNVKAFISHGGLLGTMEAVHSGTPMVVMPQFGDQHANAQAVAKAGGGVVLYMSEANEETIYQALKTVLEPKFQSQMKQLSERFLDRPMSPLDTAIYWVEYVARHKGAHFMKTAAVNMPFYQYYLLDVLAFIILVISVVCYTICIFVRTVIRKMFGSSNAEPKKKQKKS